MTPNQHPDRELHETWTDVHNHDDVWPDAATPEPWPADVDPHPCGSKTPHGRHAHLTGPTDASQTAWCPGVAELSDASDVITVVPGSGPGSGWRAAEAHEALQRYGHVHDEHGVCVKRRRGDLCPAPGTRWLDIQGDVWTMGTDGTMTSPECAPFPHAHVVRKWGPLTRLPAADVAPERDDLESVLARATEAGAVLMESVANLERELAELRRPLAGQWDDVGGAIWLDREEWGVVIDALVEHAAAARARVDANPASTSGVRAGMCDRMVQRITLAASVPAIHSPRTGG